MQQEGSGMQELKPVESEVYCRLGRDNDPSWTSYRGYSLPVCVFWVTLQYC